MAPGAAGAVVGFVPDGALPCVSPWARQWTGPELGIFANETLPEWIASAPALEDAKTGKKRKTEKEKKEKEKKAKKEKKEGGEDDSSSSSSSSSGPSSSSDEEGKPKGTKRK